MTPTTDIKPLQDRVLIYPDPEKEVSKGGIIIPELAKEKPSRGLVVAVGPGLKNRPTTVKVGERVVYGKYAGINFTDEKTKLELVMLRETDIFSVLPEIK